MARKILNRKELREEADAAERIEGQEEGTTKTKEKEKKAPAKKAAAKKPAAKAKGKGKK